MESITQGKFAALLSLVTSGGTLVCCALPALLVALGAGAALSSLVTAVPQLVWLSEHKDSVFAAASIMLAVAGLLQWRARGLPCPTDPALAAACTRTRKTALRVYLLSLAIFVTGGFFAFMAPLIGHTPTDDRRRKTPKTSPTSCRWHRTAPAPPRGYRVHALA
jgi:hypothetical protein